MLSIPFLEYLINSLPAAKELHQRWRSHVLISSAVHTILLLLVGFKLRLEGEIAGRYLESGDRFILFV